MSELQLFGIELIVLIIVVILLLMIVILDQLLDEITINLGKMIHLGPLDLDIVVYHDGDDHLQLQLHEYGQNKLHQIKLLCNDHVILDTMFLQLMNGN